MSDYDLWEIETLFIFEQIYFPNKLGKGLNLGV